MRIKFIRILPETCAQHFVAVGELDAKHRIGKRLDDGPLDLDRLFLRRRRGSSSFRAFFRPIRTAPASRLSRAIYCTSSIIDEPRS